MRTLERLLTYPIDIKTIILGDIFSSSLFGIMLLSVPISLAFAFGVSLNLPILILGIVLASLCFSSLGQLFSAYPSNIPATVMISALVRFPLIHKWDIYFNRPATRCWEDYSFRIFSDLLHRYRKVLFRIGSLHSTIHRFHGFNSIHSGVPCTVHQASREVADKENLKVNYL